MISSQTPYLLLPFVSRLKVKEVMATVKRCVSCCPRAGTAGKPESLPSADALEFPQAQSLRLEMQTCRSTEPFKSSKWPRGEALGPTEATEITPQITAINGSNNG